MQDKPVKTISMSLDTHEEIQNIAKRLSIEKKLPVSLTSALKFIVEFYKEQHQEKTK